jgi:hypothetical protein
LPVKWELEGKNMRTAKRLTIDTVNLDDEREMDALDEQMIEAGLERIRAEGDELRRRGLLDAQGNVLLDKLPPDMRENSERDFGG